MVLTEKWIVRVLASGGWEGRFITESLTVRVLASGGRGGGSSMGELKPGETACQRLGEKAGSRAVSKGHVLSLSFLPIN